MRELEARERLSKILVIVLAAGAFGCSDIRLPASDARSMDSGVRDGGIRDAGVRDGGIRDGGIRDGGIRDGGLRDSGEIMMPPDSGSEIDSGRMCDVAQCSVALDAVPLKVHNDADPDHEQRACCISTDRSEPYWTEEIAGQCGVVFPHYYNGPYCGQIVAGELDETCLDTVVDGEIIQGCRRTDGQCGHLTPGWGCHRFYRYYWELNVDDRDSELPNPFNCTPVRERCTRSSQCCAHENYGRVCWPTNEDGEEWDAGPGEDGGLPLGYCNWAQYVDDPDSTPYPN
jgi:hypothetical protein